MELTVLSIPRMILCSSSPVYELFVSEVSTTSVSLEEDWASEPSMIVPIRVIYWSVLIIKRITIWIIMARYNWRWILFSLLLRLLKQINNKLWYSLILQFLVMEKKFKFPLNYVIAKLPESWYNDYWSENGCKRNAVTNHF